MSRSTRTGLALIAAAILLCLLPRGEHAELQAIFTASYCLWVCGFAFLIWSER